MAAAKTRTAVGSRAQQLESAQRLRTVIGQLSRSLRPTAAGRSQGLTPTRTSVLLAADRHGPIRLSEIAEREGLNPTLLSRTVANLVDAGLVERTADAADRRSAWVNATDAGRATAGEIRHERTVHVYDALARLGAEDQTTVTAALPALERLLASLRANAGEDPATGRRPRGAGQHPAAGRRP